MRDRQFATISSRGRPTSHDPNTFVEAGVDLNNLLGHGGGCFTTFLAESRSSPEITATLKDFAGGQFNTCPSRRCDDGDPGRFNQAAPVR